MKKTALLLFSGGLDSILAAEILRKEKIKVVLVCCKSFFFDCQSAQRLARRLKLKLKVIDLSKEHLETVKRPKYGRGQGVNPCIDCHILMIKKAKEILKREKFDFLATGEVLGERPFSQNRKVFKLAEKKLDLEGFLLRPLSAKLLPLTIPEKKGWVKKEKLFGFQGKSRKPQMALAKKMKLKKFPTPAGGCILTDPEYSKRLRELFEKVPNCDGNDCQILRKGRIFWLAPQSFGRVGQNKFLIIVGRNERENKEIYQLIKKKDLILEPKNFPGPTILVRGFRGQITKKLILKGAELLLNYSKKIPEKIIIEVKK